MPHLLSSPDKWRGTATAAGVAHAVERAAVRLGWTADVAPVADGGEGFLDVLGGANRVAQVRDASGRYVKAGWRLQDGAAFIEMARASGLALAGGPTSNDALAADTAGTGELVVAALDAGARRVVVGLGGSATTDGGLGCAEVLKDDPRIPGVDLVGACDVMVPFAAALDFAPQKGASPAETRLLEGRLERVAQRYESDLGVDVRRIPGAGAAGGLGGGLAALGARLVPGIEVVAAALGLDERLARADLVVTGEGLLDVHSFEGKAVGWVLDLALARDIPALIVVGEAAADAAARVTNAGARLVSLVERYGPERSRSNTLDCIEAAIEDELGP